MNETSFSEIVTTATVAGVPLTSEEHAFIPQPGSDKLLIIFSATGTKPGSFNLWKISSHLPYNKLYLRSNQDDWYQNGVGALGGSIERTVDSIRRLIEGFGIKGVYTCGSSMGAMLHCFLV